MSGGALSIGAVFYRDADPFMNWDDVAEMVRLRDGQFCLKGIMTAADAARGRDRPPGIVLSNHGGRSAARGGVDQLAEIVDAVGERIDVIMDGGIQRGPYPEGAARQGRGDALSFPLAAAGQAGVERALA